MSAGRTACNARSGAQLYQRLFRSPALWRSAGGPFIDDLRKLYDYTYPTRAYRYSRGR